MKRPRLTLRFIAIFVTLVGLLNWLFLEFLRRSGGYHDSPYYDFYLKTRSFLLSPTILVADLLFVSLGLWWIFKPRKHEPADEWNKIHEVDRLFLFAMILGNIGGLLLLYFVKL